MIDKEKKARSARPADATRSRIASPAKGASAKALAFSAEAPLSSSGSTTRAAAKGTERSKDPSGPSQKPSCKKATSKGAPSRAGPKGKSAKEDPEVTELKKMLGKPTGGVGAGSSAAAMPSVEPVKTKAAASAPSTSAVPKMSKVVAGTKDSKESRSSKMSKEDERLAVETAQARGKVEAAAASGPRDVIALLREGSPIEREQAAMELQKMFKDDETVAQTLCMMEFLRTVPVFTHLTNETVYDLTRLVETLDLTEGEYVMHEGEVADVRAPQF